MRSLGWNFRILSWYIWPPHLYKSLQKSQARVEPPKSYTKSQSCLEVSQHTQQALIRNQFARAHVPCGNVLTWTQKDPCKTRLTSKSPNHVCIIYIYIIHIHIYIYNIHLIFYNDLYVYTYISCVKRSPRWCSAWHRPRGANLQATIQSWWMSLQGHSFVCEHLRAPICGWNHQVSRTRN